MAILNSAAIHCHDCECGRTYSGTTKVGDQNCEHCDHPLRHHQVDAQAVYAIDATGTMPERL